MARDATEPDAKHAAFRCVVSVLFRRLMGRCVPDLRARKERLDLYTFTAGLLGPETYVLGRAAPALTL